MLFVELILKMYPTSYYKAVKKLKKRMNLLATSITSHIFPFFNTGWKIAALAVSGFFFFFVGVLLNQVY